MTTNVAKIITPSHTYEVPFELDSHQWDVYSGFEPKVQPWLVPEEVAAAIRLDLLGLVAPANEVQLVVGDVAAPMTVSRVIYLGMTAASNPQMRYVLFTDVRWYFGFAIMATDVNVRRRVGENRLIGDTITSSVVAPTVAYGAWSLNAGAAYTWDTYKTQVLNYLTSNTHGRPAITWTTDSFTMATITAQVCQESSTDLHGNEALAEAIENVPGAGIYVSIDGHVHVHETTGGAEFYFINQLSPELMDHGDLVMVSMEQERPSNAGANPHAWRIYFNYEVEMRMDYDTSASLGMNDPYLIPVLQVTDISLTIPAGTYYGGIVRTSSNNVVAQGSWIGQDQAFAAWGTQTCGILTLPQLTDDIVANHFAGDSLQRYNYSGSGAAFDPIWAARIAEIMRCFRTKFMVNPQFWGLVRHAWAVRAAIWDPTTGARAPAPVYSNFNVQPVDPHFDSTVFFYGKNVTDSYPSTKTDLNTGRPSGFTVDVEDEELGILSIIRDLSRYAGNSQILPSPVPTLAQFVDDDTTLKEPNLQVLESNTTWKLALVISLGPAAPNDLRRLYEVQVSMHEASVAAGLVTETTTGAAPDQEMRTHLADARVPWVDGGSGTSAYNLAILGVADTGGAISNQNPITGAAPINLTQELQPLARALAACDLMSKQDHYEGQLAVPASSTTHNLVPRGSIDHVTHKSAGDYWVSVIHCTPKSKHRNPLDYLPGSARSYILKQIQSVR